MSSHSVYAGPPVVRVALEHPNYGSWGEVEVARERAGVYPGANVVTASMLQGGAMQAHARLLSNDELWAIYKQVPDVRAAFEAIIRVISTWDWSVEPAAVLPKDDPLYDVALDIAEEAQRFLSAPNEDGEVWQTFCSKAARDLLVFDEWASENVLDDEGVLEELVVLAGGTVKPRVDRHQRVVDYVQVTGSSEVHFSRDQIVYFSLFPDSSHPGGNPLIETLIHEVITLMRASKHLMMAYDADEVPPGVLLLAGIAGKAADRAVYDLRNMRGADHKLRVLTTNNPRGLDARWVEFRHTPKDLDMESLIKEIRRTVWRLTGVKPVTMGDTEATPRATAEVQVEAEDSGLIRPILELLQAQVNMRVLPLVVGDPSLSGLVRFTFDMSRDATSQDTEAEARADASDFDRGGLTINELRTKRGRLPIEGGDIALIKQGNMYTQLAHVLEGGAPTEDEGAADSGVDAGEGGEDVGEVGDGTGDAAAPEQGEEAPGEAEAAKPRIGQVVSMGRSWRETGMLTHGAARCSCGSHHSEPRRGIQKRSAVSRASELLPSDWQPDGKFSGYRTLRLDKLGTAVMDYTRAVSPLYTRAQIDVTSAFRSAIADGTLSNEEAASLNSRVAKLLDKLHTQWDGATAEYYREAARVGRDAAADFTGVAVVEDWRARGDLYQAQAMAYLVDGQGLISTLKSQLTTLIVASVRGTDEHAMATRGLVEELDVLNVLAAVGKVFDRNRHRIDNWSGRLVELANDVFGLGMEEGGAPAPPPDEEVPGDPGPSGEWWVEWATVGDKNTCATCEREGSAGFRPLSQVQIRPGGATECRARCRCVLVFWTREEVESGAAVGLSGAR